MIALDLLRAGAVTLVAAPALALLRKAPGRVRHAAFAAALAASALAPFAVGLVPRPVVEITPALPRLGRPLGVSDPGKASHDAPPPLPASLRTAPLPSEPWRPPEGLILLPALIPLGRMALGWRTARRWARRAAPGPDGASLSDDAPTPMTFFDGLRHRILLPAEAVGWSEDRRRAVLLHERAHIERGDWWTQTAARIVVAFQWMNPFAWWMLRGLADAAEECADQAALRGVPPQTYARELLALARPGPRPAGSLPMTPKTDIGRRIVTVLKGQRPASRGAISLATLVPLALVLPAAALGGRGAYAQIAGHPDTALRREAEAGFGDAANGWSAGLPGMGKAKLECVVGWFKDTPVAWRPDGTPIPVAGLPIAPVRPAPEYAYDAKVKKYVKSGRSVMGETMYVVGFDDPTGVMEAGSQSASSADGPSNKRFGRGSWTTDPGKPGWRHTAGFVAYPQGYETVDGKTAFTDAVGFAAGPADAKTIFSFDEAKGATMTPNPDGIPDFQQDGFSFREIPGTKGLDLVVKMKKIPSDYTKQPWLVAVATGKDGRVDTQSPFLQYEGPKAAAHPFYRYALPRSRSEYRSIEIRAGSTVTTEFRDVALLPSSALRSDVGRTRVTQLSVARAHLGKTEEQLAKLMATPLSGSGVAKAKTLQRYISDDRDNIAHFEYELARIVTGPAAKG